jgi:3-methyl-2-oxobutanoate hydroxymethyltransferase
MLGMYEKFKPKFVRLYAQLASEIKEAVNHYSRDVKNSTFPSEEESF